MEVASLFGLSTTQALVLLFVVLPVVLAAVIVPFVAWRTRNYPKPVLTSEILAHGDPGEAEIVSVRPLGSFLEFHPMVRFVLKVTMPGEEGPFHLEVIQSFPRSVIRDFRPGEIVDVRLTADRSAGAVVWAGPAF